MERRLSTKKSDAPDWRRAAGGLVSLSHKGLK